MYEENARNLARIGLGLAVLGLIAMEAGGREAILIGFTIMTIGTAMVLVFGVIYQIYIKLKPN